MTPQRVPRLFDALNAMRQKDAGKPTTPDALALLTEPNSELHTLLVNQRGG